MPAELLDRSCLADSVTAHPCHSPGETAPFAWLSPDHPWQAAVEAIRRAVADRERSLEWMTGDDGIDRHQVHAELKGVRLPDGRWRLDRSYWSEQFRSPQLPYGLRARTLSVDAQGDQCWLTWPDDQYLNDVSNWLRQEDPQRVEVLRYVPLRRLTFRWSARDGQSSIGKSKRRSRFRDAYRLLGATSEAVSASVRAGPRLLFRVADPLHLVPESSLYFQETLPGEDLADRLVTPQADLLSHVGLLHAQLHALPHDGLGSHAPGDARAQALQDIDWIGWLMPQWVDALKPLAQAITQRPACADHEARFCHGDLVCSQFLAGPQLDEPWGITDFDLAHRGDPCRDMAILIASLPYDVPVLRRAEESPTATTDLEFLTEAYLAGYARAAGGLAHSEVRLCWHRICAEVYYLGLMLKKDRYHPLVFERRLQRAARLAGVREWQ